MQIDGETAIIRDASRRMVRELGFLADTLAGTRLPPSAVHALIEIGWRGSMTAAELSDVLLLEKSSVSRMLGKLISAGELASVAHETDGRAKRLVLTDQGRVTLGEIDRFGRTQVEQALSRLPASARSAVATGISSYADALTACRTEPSATPRQTVQITQGFQPGLIGRAVEMHARFYNRIVGFGQAFESKVAAEMAAFVDRLDRPVNGLWSASLGGSIVGTVAIDGEDLGDGIAHLRWFIVDDGFRGAGIGRRLLAEAVSFCDAHDYRETHLWTFRGLDAARRLYEESGFTLTEEQVGRRWGEEVVQQRLVRVKRRLDPIIGV